MTEVIMPKMGDGMEEGTLLEWLKKEGDAVKSGEVIGTIQTDKATLELESPGKGRLAGILIQPGATVPVGVPIAALLKEGEELPAGWGGASGAPAATAAPVAEEAPVAAAAGTISESTAPAVEGRVKASPLAKRIAAEAGLDISRVAGSGPGGRIVEKDVRDALANGTAIPADLGVAPSAPAAASVAPASTPAAPAAPSMPKVVATPGVDTKIPLNRLRQIIAERTTHSKQAVPHFYVTVEVDLEKINALREAFKEEEAGKISVNDFVVRATVVALQEMPIINATYQGDHILQHGSVNIGIAAAVDDGLLVPVIHNAEAMTLRQLSDAAKYLVTKARDGKLTPNEMQGSTFSISNMGMLNVDTFGAIINEPNAGILAISSARKRVVVGDDDEIEVRWKMNITGSFDHRVVDGAIGAAFVNKVREALENPMRLLS